MDETESDNLGAVKRGSKDEARDAGMSDEGLANEIAGRTIVLLLGLSLAAYIGRDSSGGPLLAATLIVADCLTLIVLYPKPGQCRIRHLAWLTLIGAVVFLASLEPIY